MFDFLGEYWKKITSAILSMLLLFVTSFVGDVPKAKDPIIATRTDYSFDTDRILIGGYNYNINYTDDEHVGYVRDAGIDFLVTRANEDFLDACERFGIGVIAKNYSGLPTYGWLLDRTENAVAYLQSRRFYDHPAVWGNDLMDEPATDSFPILPR